jgi:hypothetical protein
MHTDKLKYKELTHLIIMGFHEAQLLNYLKATTIEMGLLMTMRMSQRLNGSFTINSKSNLFNPCQSVAE